MTLPLSHLLQQEVLGAFCRSQISNQSWFDRLTCVFHKLLTIETNDDICSRWKIFVQGCLLLVQTQRNMHVFDVLEVILSTNKHASHHLDKYQQPTQKKDLWNKIGTTKPRFFLWIFRFCGSRFPSFTASPQSGMLPCCRVLVGFETTNDDLQSWDARSQYHVNGMGPAGGMGFRIFLCMFV